MPSSQNDQIISGWNKNTTYTVTLTANGSATVTRQATFTTNNCTPPPLTISTLTADAKYTGFDASGQNVTNGCINVGSQLGKNAVKFSWTATNATGYYLTWSAGRYPVSGNMAATQKEQIISGWEPNRTYTVTLTAVGSSSTSINKEVSFTTTACNITPFAGCWVQGDTSFEIVQGQSATITIPVANLRGAGGPWLPRMKFFNSDLNSTFISYATQVDIGNGLYGSISPERFTFPATQDVKFSFSTTTSARPDTYILSNLSLVYDQFRDTVADCSGRVTITVKPRIIQPTLAPMHGSYDGSGYDYMQYAMGSRGLYCHQGQDMQPGNAWIDPFIYSPFEGVGTVVYAGWYNSGYGNVVEVQSGPWKVRYAHLGWINTNVGANVTPDQILGSYGNTGYSTGAHLHYEVTYNGILKDPVQYGALASLFGYSDNHDCLYL